MARPRGNSASITMRTRSSTSWMLTSATTRGERCGASSRSTSACSRSASAMITRVYSRWSGVSSDSRSWAAPRTPPSGFLISCARLRISWRLASVRPSWRSSRSTFSCCSISDTSSTTGVASASWAVAVTCTCSGSRPTRRSSMICLRWPNALPSASDTSCRMPASSPRTRPTGCPTSVLRDVSNSSSAAWFTWTMRAFASSSSTAVDSRSSPS